MTKVRVYYNLHRRLWSVQDARTRRVVAHVRELVLVDAVFKVSEAGRQRVLATKRKNVHAVVCGTLDGDVVALGSDGHAVTYNPYRAPTFVRRDTCDPVHAATRVHMVAPEGAPPQVTALL